MAKVEQSGGPAFPLENPRHLENGELFKQFTGMSLRDWFAGQAPVEYGVVCSAFGDAMPNSDAGRAAFFAVWSLLRYEYADAMLAERDKGGV